MTHDELQNNSSDTGIKVPMTHDELLAEINDHTDFDRGYLLGRALRAVVELHKPKTGEFEDYNPNALCEECIDDYPCPTIQAIEKELK